ncbi:MAG: methionine adenosyltransferase [Alphaproteobacteria bacterium]|nr:methionine adenosyltransferase [Alphaproteobacteria bacterium]
MSPDITLVPQPSVADAAFEVVERKGLGHPDTICDALAEEVSLGLSRYYLERFGLILHHNVDKALLRGGAARATFNGGEVVEPIEIYLAGRATHHYRGVDVPVESLAIEASKAWLKSHCHALDVDRHISIHSLIRPGSTDLVDLYVRQQTKGDELANDTSCGIGFAPLTPLERLVLETEKRLNTDASHRAQPAIGEDIKVMGVRQKHRIHLTVACAMVDRFLPDLSAYFEIREQVAEKVRAFAGELVDDPVGVDVNAADDPSTGSVYLTVTGTSAEAGDDGEAGRGNRVNGLITPFRPTTMESVSGKNPVTHVGKLYNLCAGLAAEALVERVAGIKAAQCIMVREIGQPITQPAWVGVQVALADETTLLDVRPAIEEIVQAEISSIPNLRTDLLKGRLALDRWPLRVPPGTSQPTASQKS